VEGLLAGRCSGESPQFGENCRHRLIDLTHHTIVLACKRSGAPFQTATHQLPDRPCLVMVRAHAASVDIGRWLFLIAAPENATFRVVMMQFGTHDSSCPRPSSVDLCGQQHAERWCCEVDPQRRPRLRHEARAKSARGVHTHA
jgi:hypothetical protein